METCVVGCKLPHGLIIDLKPVKDDRGIMVSSETLKLNGANSSRVIGGHGVTRGVDRAAMEAWMIDHAKTPFVLNKSVWIVDNDKDLKAKAKEMRDAPTGMEPIDPLKKDPKRGTDKLDIDVDARKALSEARANNPMRNRQVDTLDE